MLCVVISVVCSGLYCMGVAVCVGSVLCASGCLCRA